MTDTKKEPPTAADESLREQAVEATDSIAAPTVDTSTATIHDAPFAISDKQLRRANAMQYLFFGFVMLLILDGLLNLVLIGRVSTGSYVMFLVIFGIILLATIAVCATSLADSSRIRKQNSSAMVRWVAAKYGLELSRAQAHVLQRNECMIGSTRGWDKLDLQGYPNGVQVTHAPKHGYRLVTSNGETDTELPRARANRFVAEPKQA